MVKQKKNPQKTVSQLWPVTIENSVEGDTYSNLEEIKRCNGVTGYIVRNTTSATINFDDPSKLTGYAILSSLMHETSEKLSELFDMGKVRKVIVEGKDRKTLHVDTDGDLVDIIMEKQTDTEEIMQKIRS